MECSHGLHMHHTDILYNMKIIIDYNLINYYTINIDTYASTNGPGYGSDF